MPPLGSLPLIYPFLVNDPGEGTQAKRRAHATIVDHLVPPMARAESYGDIARLEQLLDEYGNVSAMDPAKAPALQGEIWTLLRAAKMDQDLGLTVTIPTTTRSTSSSARSITTCARSRTSRSATASTS
jgi:cobaltochelatase CobN